MEEEKHYLAILIELELFPRLRLCDEDDRLSTEERNKIKNSFKEDFISISVDRCKTMTEKEIREHVDYVLNRTKKNADEMKKTRNDAER